MVYTPVTLQLGFIIAGKVQLSKLHVKWENVANFKWFDFTFTGFFLIGSRAVAEPKVIFQQTITISRGSH